MSRTHKGSKKGFSCWSKRPYNNGGRIPYLQALTHRKERMQNKQHLHNTLKDEENLVERPTRLVYPVSDGRVKALAIIAWGKHSAEYLMEENTHYSIEEEWFCDPELLRAHDLLCSDIVVSTYDDYLKEQRNGD